MSDFEHEKDEISASEDEALELDELEYDDETDELEIDTELFAEQLLRFPCFQDAPRDKGVDVLFDTVYNAYQDENLSEEQDHVIELLLHLQEEDCPFNLTRAMEVWGKADRQVFLQLLAELSQLFDEE